MTMNRWNAPTARLACLRTKCFAACFDEAEECFVPLLQPVAASAAAEAMRALSRQKRRNILLS
jgi:hypothetical protein